MVISIASLYNFADPDVLFIVVFMIGIPVAIVVILYRILKKIKAPGPSGAIHERLRELEELKAKGMITKEECETQRERILGSL